MLFILFVVHSFFSFFALFQVRKEPRRRKPRAIGSKRALISIEVMTDMVDFEIFRGVHGAIASIFGIEVEGNFNIVRLKFHKNRFISSKVMNNLSSK